jgi:outer membrane receptor protein involved in Fe transport
LAGPGLAQAADTSDAPIATNPSAPDQSSGETVVVKGVTVTAAPHPKVTATFSEGTIPAETVRDLSTGASTTIQTLLNQEPSVFVFSNGPLGVRTNEFYRAFNSSQFAETIDGIGINDVFNNGVTNEADNANNVLLTKNDIDSVETYRGINTPAVNSYTSLGGTINFTTRAPSARAGGEAGFSFGSFDTLQWHTTIDTGQHDGLSQLVSIEDASSDGWKATTKDRNLNVYYAADYQLNQDNRITARLVYDNNSGQTPYDIPVSVLNTFGHDYQFPTGVEYNHNTNSAEIGIVAWTTKLAPNVTLETKAFGGGHDYNRLSFVNSAYGEGDTLPNPGLIPLEGPFAGGVQPFETIDSPSASKAFHNYGYATWTAGDTTELTVVLPHNTIVTGFNYTYGWLHSTEYFGRTAAGAYTHVDGEANGDNDFWDEHDWRAYASVFIQDEVALFADRLHVTAGLKYLYAGTRDYDAPSYYGDAGTVADQEHFLSPTISANFKITNHLALYAAFGRNAEFPPISAFYNNTPNGNEYGSTSQPLHTHAEYVNDYEAGVAFDYKSTFVTVNYYREDFTGMFIDGSDPETGNPTTVNSPSPSTYQGWELKLLHDLHSETIGDTHLYLSYAHNEAEFLNTTTITTTTGNILNGVVVSRGPLADVPQNLLSSGVSWKKNGWRVNLNGRYVGKQYIDQDYVGVTAPASAGNILHPYFLMDLGVSKTIDVMALGRSHQVRFGINVDNLLDRYYFNQAYTNYDTHVPGNYYTSADVAAPRSVIGSITIAF